jgi:hypothetical protein
MCVGIVIHYASTSLRQIDEWLSSIVVDEFSFYAQSNSYGYNRPVAGCLLRLRLLDCPE